MENLHFDDTPLKDEWQKEVYQFARDVLNKNGLRSVLDVGCGGGYKLLQEFEGAVRAGVEVEPTLSWLRSTYPSETWLEQAEGHWDLVVCSDVIEHVQDPDALLRSILSVRPKWIVISTPDRDLIPKADPLGPPRNKAHIREWSFEEFGSYLSEHLEVVEHFISNAEQCTQCCLCKQKSPE